MLIRNVIFKTGFLSQDIKSYDKPLDKHETKLQEFIIDGFNKNKIRLLP
jgi:hypothetical protein